MHRDPNDAEQDEGRRASYPANDWPGGCQMRTASLLLLLFEAASCERMPFDLHGPCPLPEDDPDAHAAVQQSITEHEEHHRNVCKWGFCGPVKTVAPLEYDMYPVGMPSVDYPDALEAANAQIHVSRTPLFTAEEMERVIELAEEEGIATRGDPTQAARASMKYGAQGQVAIGTKVELMPRVNAWFVTACEKVLFPHMASLFPSLISDGSQLRAHTIAVLKYSSTHLSMTLALALTLP